MNDYTVTRTTIETFGMKAESMKVANEAFKQGQGDLMTVNTQVVIRPRASDKNPREMIADRVARAKAANAKIVEEAQGKDEQPTSPSDGSINAVLRPVTNK